MRFSVFIAFLAGSTGIAPLSCAVAAEAPAAIRSALAAHDRAVHVHDTWIRDPFVVRGPDGFYYYTGTSLRPEAAADPANRYNNGLKRESLVGWTVPVWRSADLVTWESLGTPYTLKDTVWYTAARAIFDRIPPDKWRVWAPELHWIGDRWALIHTTPAPLAPKVGGTLVLSAGPGLEGPWTSPLGTRIGKRHDPSLFQDDDGTWWMIWGATEIARLKPDFSSYVGEPIHIGPSGENAKLGHEGCLIEKIEGRYVLFGTGWSTGEMRKGSYNLYYTTADRVEGPYGERKFAGRFLGHGTPFRDKDGRWWCTAFYNGDVPPLPSAGIETRDLGATAQTINDQGLTLVPLDVYPENGDVVIRARDPRYAVPGPDERQHFDLPPLSGTDAGASLAAPVPGRWTEARARAWMARQPWLIGANFLPSDAINQLEMWQEASFDPVTIDRELGWAEALGMNTMRVFLHDMVWAADPEGLYRRMDAFLAICERHEIRPMFVFFDDCHLPDPKLGPQPPPVPAYHNSGWMNSPARAEAVRYARGGATMAEVAALRGYIQGTMRRFADDPRVLMWELYNEPGRGRFADGPAGGKPGRRSAMGDHSARLLHDAWAWAREVAPSQPICSTGRGAVGELNLAIADANSDIRSFHSYEPPAGFEKLLAELKAEQPGRPLLCTEYMARTNGSTFEGILPILEREGIGAINWGLVAGKSGTIWPWSSRQGKDVDALRAAGTVVHPDEPMPEPKLWFHDIFRPDGTPYRRAETELIRTLAARAAAQPVSKAP